MRATRRQAINNTLDIDAVRVFVGGVAAGMSYTRLRSNSLDASTGATANAVSVENSQSFIPVYGRFRDDPTWNDFVASMEEFRQGINSIEPTNE